MHHSKNGFTLIEMLVTITIMMVVLGGGIAAYITFNDRQKVTTSARELQQFIRSAQVKARVGQTPSGCGRLEAYRVSGASGGSTVTLSAVCDNPPNIIEVNTLTLQNGVTLSSAIALDYITLSGGVTGAGFITINLGTTYSYRFNVTTGGAVSGGTFLQ